MARMSWSEFRRALRVANPKLVFKGNSMSLGSMVYIDAPGHPDVLEGTTLLEVLAIASPTFFRLGCPEKDGVEIVNGKKLWFRGYVNFFKQLMKRKDSHGQDIVKDKQKLKQVLPASVFRIYNARKHKDEWIESVSGQDSEFEKKRKWLKDRSKPIAGNGMPLDWKREKIYSMGGVNTGLEYAR